MRSPPAAAGGIATAERTIPVYSLADGCSVGIVLSPEHVKVLCSYASDAISYNYQCEPPGARPDCVPGCKRAGGVWAAGAFRGELGLVPMLSRFRSSGRGGYNEVVVDAKAFAERLPQAVEAVYYHQAAAPRAQELARGLQRAFVRHFQGTQPREEAGSTARRGNVPIAPLLSFDVHNWRTPFSEDV